MRQLSQVYFYVPLCVCSSDCVTVFEDGNKQQQIPFGDDNKKDKCNYKQKNSELRRQSCMWFHCCFLLAVYD